MEFGGIGPKSLQNATKQTAKSAETALEKSSNKTSIPTSSSNVSPNLPSAAASESVSISLAAQHLYAQEQAVSKVDPQDAKISQLKKLVASGDYQQGIDNQKLAKNILSSEDELFSKQ